MTKFTCSIKTFFFFIIIIYLDKTNKWLKGPQMNRCRQ